MNFTTTAHGRQTFPQIDQAGAGSETIPAGVPFNHLNDVTE